MKMKMKMKTALLFLLALPLVFCGCAGPKIAVDLLGTAPVSQTPATKSSSAIQVTINPRINNYEKLDESVKQSLEIAIAKANLFGSDLSRRYRIDANILTASQSPMSFGSFEGIMEIRYVVRDPDGKEILDKTILVEAGSDQWSFVGLKRARRSRAVQIAKNVCQFVEALQAQLLK